MLSELVGELEMLMLLCLQLAYSLLIAGRKARVIHDYS